MATTKGKSMQAPAWRIVQFLQKEGTATHKDLESHLGLTRTAVREHVATLESSGYLTRETVVQGRGRPHHEYSNTDKARSLFACHCGDLSVTMLSEMMELVPVATVNVLMARLARRVAQEYAANMRSESLEDRVHELAELMSAKGILCQVHEESDGSRIQLELFNCPYHDLAMEHQEICTMDRDMIGYAIGTPVELVDCIMEDSHSCHFGFELETQPVQELVG